MSTGIRLRYPTSSGTLGDSLTDTGTMITFSAAPEFNTLQTNEYIALALDADESANNVEIVHLTTYTAGEVTGTIERGQESTTAVAHASAEDWLHGPTMHDWDELADTRHGGREVHNSSSGVSGTVDVDLNDGNVHEITIDGDTTFTFSNAETGVGVGFTLVLKQDGTGGHAVTWPASVVWHEGTAPTLTTSASTISILSFFTVDGGGTWFGSLVGDAFA